MRGWLTVRQAAKKADFTEEYIRRLIRQGRLQAHKVGKLWSIRKASLNSYLAKRKGKTRMGRPKKKGQGSE